MNIPLRLTVRATERRVDFLAKIEPTGKHLDTIYIELALERVGSSVVASERKFLNL